MARIQSTEEVHVDKLVIGPTQARVRGVGREIDDLAESIRVHGLLEPIVICPGPDEKYQVIMGQRRLLAHKRLGRDKILAVIIDEPVDETTAKVLSLTENLIRQDLDAKDVIDACTALFKRYGNAKAVAEETGLPYPKVLRHVKYDRLAPPMKTLVDSGRVSIDLALRVQDAIAPSPQGGGQNKEAVELACQLAPLTGAEQRQILRKKKRDPDKSTMDLLKSTPRDARSRQIIVTISAADLRELQSYARTQGITQDQAGAGFIIDALTRIGSSSLNGGYRRAQGDRPARAGVRPLTARSAPKRGNSAATAVKRSRSTA